MKNERLSNAQRKVLADWLVGVEDFGVRHRGKQGMALEGINRVDTF